jgi:hypothetical protein
LEDGESLHNIWLPPYGCIWLAHHLSSHKNIVATIVLQFQQVVRLYIRIANSLEYCQAVKAKKQINPCVYEEASRRVRHIISSMNNLIPGITLGNFIIKPIACGLFYIEDRATKDKWKKRYTKVCTGGRPHNKGGAPPCDNNCTATQGAPAWPASIATLKEGRLVKYSGPGYIPHPANILELN